VCEGKSKGSVFLILVYKIIPVILFKNQKEFNLDFSFGPLLRDFFLRNFFDFFEGSIGRLLEGNSRE